MDVFKKKTKEEKADIKKAKKLAKKLQKEKEPVCTGSSFSLILIRIYDWQML